MNEQLSYTDNWKNCGGTCWYVQLSDGSWVEPNRQMLYNRLTKLENELKKLKGKK